jgi:putative Mg2+ transporter-C (MgtC) family protein
MTNLSWVDVALRLALAAIAGMLVGYNRESHSQAAGLRTTTLVCVSACLSMILAGLLLHVDLNAADENVMRLDVMRLPLGVLTGIGFIGAGAIVRRDDVVIGVATAATLWFMTIVGLTFGAGELLLGLAVTLVALFVLWALGWGELHIRRRFRAVLHVAADPGRLSEAELRQLLAGVGQRVVAWSVIYRDAAESYEAKIELEWRGHTRDRAQPPAFLQDLSARAGVRAIEWTPQAVSV